MFSFCRQRHEFRGAAACLKAVTAGPPPPKPMTPLARWLTPHTALSGTLDLQGIPDSERGAQCCAREGRVGELQEELVHSEKWKCHTG